LLLLLTLLLFLLCIILFTTNYENDSGSLYSFVSEKICQRQ
jgi:hypothetical protein